MRLREFANQKDSRSGLLETLARRDCTVQKSPSTSFDSGIVVRGAKSLSSKVERVFDIDPENTSEFNRKIKRKRKELGLE